LPVFKFRLSRILELKEKFKEAKKAELFSVEKEIETKTGEIFRLEESIKALEATGLTSGEELKARYNRFEYALKRIEKLKGEIADLREKREKILKELVEMEREVKILDKLKEKKKEEFVRESLRQEMKFLDEISQRRRGYV